MNLTIADQSVIHGLWNCLQKVSREAAAWNREVGHIVDRIVMGGYASRDDVEMLLRLGGLSSGSILPEAVMAFAGVSMSTIWVRPRSKSGDTGGCEMLAATDLAYVLLRLEALGFPVDPEPLCEALQPTIAAKRLMTRSELEIWWRDVARKGKPVHVATQTGFPIWPAERKVTLPTGYRVEMWPGDDAGAAALRISKPIARRSHRPVEFGSQALGA